MAEDTRDEQFGADSIEAQMRERIREVIERLVEEELEGALGAERSARVEGRRGYRHGSRADADDEPGPDELRDAASPGLRRGGFDWGVAE